MLKNKVIMYCKEGCSPCNIAYTFLSSHGYEIEKRLMPEFLEELYREFPGAKGVPQVIINGEKVGGYYEVMEYIANNLTSH